MPTVATKNGGPVDIMATLHHGLLVDPTNSRQIGDALLKILTNPAVWDEMSHNGPPPPATHLPLPCSFCSSVVFAPGAWTKQAVFLHTSGSLIHSQLNHGVHSQVCGRSRNIWPFSGRKQLTWAVVDAGVANIMAYSWFSHCKKYLEALEMEKRFIKTQKVHNHCFATPSPAVGMQDLQSLLPSKATCVRLRAL